MRKWTTRERTALIVLTTLLALPIAQIASPVEAKQRARTVTRTFSNIRNVTLPTLNVSPVSASSAYPSTIQVDELPGTIRDVNVLLRDFSHPLPDDVQVLLVGPRGQTAVLMANVGATVAVSDVTLRLDDETAELLPISGLQSGVFWPTNHLGRPLAFAAPAPPVTRANAALAVFDGRSPNGTWRLFVQDPYGGSPAGGFAGGWELEITTEAKAKKNKR